MHVICGANSKLLQSRDLQRRLHCACAPPSLTPFNPTLCPVGKYTYNSIQLQVPSVSNFTSETRWPGISVLQPLISALQQPSTVQQLLLHQQRHAVFLLPPPSTSSHLPGSCGSSQVSDNTLYASSETCNIM